MSCEPTHQKALAVCVQICKSFSKILPCAAHKQFYSQCSFSLLQQLLRPKILQICVEYLNNSLKAYACLQQSSKEMLRNGKKKWYFNIMGCLVAVREPKDSWVSTSYFLRLKMDSKASIDTQYWPVVIVFFSLVCQVILLADMRTIFR